MSRPWARPTASAWSSSWAGSPASSPRGQHGAQARQHGARARGALRPGRGGRRARRAGAAAAHPGTCRHRGRRGRRAAPGDGNRRFDPSGNPVLGDFCGVLASAIKGRCKAGGLPITLKIIDPSYIVRAVVANTADAVLLRLPGPAGRARRHGRKTGLMIARSTTATSMCPCRWSPANASTSTSAPTTGRPCSIPPASPVSRPTSPDSAPP